MKRILTLATLCSLSLALQVNAAQKTKYICSLGGLTTIEFATKEECFASCFQPGVAAVCEETGINTEVQDTEDTEDIY